MKYLNFSIDKLIEVIQNANAEECIVPKGYRI